MAEYKEFRVGDILEVSPTKKLTELGPGYIKDSDIISDDGETPYIAAVSTNNGISGYSIYEPTNEGGVITVSTTADSSNTLFYQKEPFIGRQQMAQIKHINGDKLNQRVAAYLISLFRRHMSTFNYGTKLRIDNLVEMMLLLPVTPFGQPDFVFMENYIKEIEQKYIKKLESDLATRTEDLLTVIGRGDLIGDPEGLAAVVDKGFDDSGMEYAEFRVGDLFDINPTKAYTTLKDEEIMVGDETPFITTTVSNNGIRGYSDLEPLNKGNSLTASDTTTSDAIFYQADDYIGRSHVQGLHPKFKGFNKAVAMYILTAFRKSADGLYDYGTKFNRVKMRATTIELPITATGTPNLDFMEQYIAHIELKFTHTLMQWIKAKELL